jgi:hypothetical protein
MVAPSSCVRADLAGNAIHDRKDRESRNTSAYEVVSCSYMIKGS